MAVDSEDYFKITTKLGVLLGIWPTKSKLRRLLGILNFTIAVISMIVPQVCINKKNEVIDVSFDYVKMEWKNRAFTMAVSAVVNKE